MKKKISILGSTGSVGVNTLEIINKKKSSFEPFIFSANKNYNLICKQITKYKPSYFVINDKTTYEKVLKKFKNKKVKILNNYDEINFKKKKSITISAIPGITGLYPLLKLTEFSQKILIANKEAIICGWNLIKKKAERYDVKIIPIDSEHYSLLKLLEKQKKEYINKIYLTASGGPFLNFKPSKLKNVKLKHALKHPKWKMGKKISIDSSTLMNKIFEVIEAHKLFDISYDQIKIIIHPNSLVHAILELKNGIKKFIYHDTSMKIPIANAIFDGELDINFFYKNTNSKIETLIFKKVNKKIFPSILIKKEMSKYPSSGIILNAANEVLVEHFLKEKIHFLDIIKTIMSVLKDDKFKKYAIRKPKNINQIYQIDLWSRNLTLKKIYKKLQVKL